jgi:hypothetical protein
MKFKILLFFLVITSCDTTKNIKLKDEGNINDALINTILDFSKSVKFENKMYYVRKDENSKDLYRFTYTANYTYYITKEDIIGSKSRHFPSSYKEVNGTLFIWKDSTKIITKKIFSLLTQNKIIDSTLYKVKEGILPENNYVSVVTDESKKYTMYYVCKNNINRFLRVYSNTSPPPSRYPLVDCSNN